VGGAVIAIIIVVSFLSLMSFAEFLRFQWGGAQQQRLRVGDRRNFGNGANNRVGGGIDVDIIEGDIDEIDVYIDRDNDDDPLAPFVNHLMANDEDSVESFDNRSDSENDDAAGRGRPDDRRQQNGVLRRSGGRDTTNDDINENNGNDGAVQPQNVMEDEDDFEIFMRAQEEQAVMDEGHHLGPPGVDDNHNMPDNIRQPQQILRNAANPQQRDNARFEPQFEPLQPAFADIDALDEGPVSYFYYYPPPSCHT
jgi:hypothetical protein